MLKKIPSYIVVEGPDGSGKDTIIEYLKEHEELNADFYQEPSPENPIGRIIRHDILSGESYSDYQIEGLLFTADRYLTQRTEMKKSWNSGRNIISNRSFISSLAYQLKDDILFNKVLIELQKRVIAPDMVLFTAIDSDTIIERNMAKDKKEIFENEKFLRELPIRYLRALYIAQYIFPTIEINYVDCKQPKKDMKEESLKKVIDFMEGNYKTSEKLNIPLWRKGELFHQLHEARMYLKERLKGKIENKDLFFEGIESAFLRRAVRDFIYGKGDLFKEDQDETISSLDEFLWNYVGYEDIIDINSKEVRKLCEEFFEKHEI